MTVGVSELVKERDRRGCGDIAADHKVCLLGALYLVADRKEWTVSCYTQEPLHPGSESWSCVSKHVL